MDIVVLKRRFGFPFVVSAMCSVALLLLSFSYMVKSLQHDMLYTFVLIIFTVALATYGLYLKNPLGALHLKLSHADNQVKIKSFDKHIFSMSELHTLSSPDASLSKTRQASLIYRVAKSSKANPIGVWLHLKPILDIAQSSSVKSDVKMFIGRWQLKEEGFRALSRHLVWYIDPMEGDKLC